MTASVHPKASAPGAVGVVFVACDNTLRSRGLTPVDLVEGTRTTPSGVGHLVRRQQLGWSYLRA